MISWHRVGQKVVSLGRRQDWLNGDFTPGLPGPDLDEVLTISRVGVGTDSKGRKHVIFALEEYPTGRGYTASFFHPVYPTIIDQLRHLHAPVPSDRVEGGSDLERVKEGV